MKSDTAMTDTNRVSARAIEAALDRYERESRPDSTAREDITAARTELADLLAARERDGEALEAMNGLTVSVSQEENGPDVWLHFGPSCMVSVGSLIERRRGEIIKAAMQTWADEVVLRAARGVKP